VKQLIETKNTGHKEVSLLANQCAVEFARTCANSSTIFWEARPSYSHATGDFEPFAFMGSRCAVPSVLFDLFTNHG
jgi:hypothetical protein